jgi:hypothetical protein
VEVLFGGGFLFPGSEVVGAEAADTSWLDRFEFDVLGSVGEIGVIAKDVYGDEVEHDAAS